MLTLLSPAKNLNFDPAPTAPKATKPQLAADAGELLEAAKALPKGKLKSMMRLSDSLADLNFERFQAIASLRATKGTKQAALAFNGDVYLGLEAKSLNTEELEYAQDHLRILSGLYGILRPLDGIFPYRLEMGAKLQNPRGEDLYAFWGERIAALINKAVKAHDDKTIVNLASNEYFSAVDRRALKSPVVTPVFKEEKDGKLRQLQFFAKRARGLMARWIVQNRIDNAAALMDFREEGYRRREDLSGEGEMVFTRPQPAPKNG